MQELLIVGRIVFQIGILHDDHVAAGPREPIPQRRPFALIDGLVNDLELAFGKQPVQLVLRVKGRLRCDVVPDRSVRRPKRGGRD